MAQYTENYNLSKPEPTDTQSSFISDYCNNMDIIDANLGSGGGNVDDVLVNGVSVVDGNHDAQITSYKEVTQAEYDALPATKLTDGIAYFIKDAGGGGGGSSSHNYSTTEQVIGTWIDGKPLYEKTVEIDSVAYNDWTDVFFLADTDIKGYDSRTSYAQLNNGERVQLDWFVTASIYNRSIITNNGTKFRVETNGNSYSKIVATIYYTKTTD